MQSLFVPLIKFLIMQSASRKRSLSILIFLPSKVHARRI